MVLEILTEFWSWLCDTSCYFRSMDELAILLLGVCCFFVFVCLLAKLTGTKLEFDENDDERRVD